MPAIRFLSIVSGRIKELAATVVSAGAADDGKIPALDASGKLDASLMPAGIGANTVAAVASEALAANDVVNLWDNGGTVNARKADATAEGKEVSGFVKAAVAQAANATVYLPGNTITGLTGLTPGSRQYASTSPGALTEVPPSTAGNVLQLVGIAASDTSVIFEPEEPITRA